MIPTAICKVDNFLMIFVKNLHILAQNIDCGYSLEFLNRTRATNIIYTSVKLNGYMEG